MTSAPTPANTKAPDTSHTVSTVIPEDLFVKLTDWKDRCGFVSYRQALLKIIGDYLSDTPVHAAREERVAIFMDVQNVLLGLRSLPGIDQTILDMVDFAMIKDYAAAGRGIVSATAYDGRHMSPDPDSGNPRAIRDQLQDLHDRISASGWTMKLRDLGYEHQQKGVDSLLYSDVFKGAYEDAFDVAVIISGDSDFVESVNVAKSKGKRVEVMAFSGSLSHFMRESADSIRLLDSIPIIVLESEEAKA